MARDGAARQGLQAEAEFGQGEQGEGGAAREQQDGLDDLYPGGGDHAAEDHVDQHQDTYHHHGRGVVEAEQQLDQLARADHLDDQIAAHHGQRTERGECADLRLIQAVGHDVGEGIAPEVAQALRHQEGDDRPADEERHRIDETVVTLGEDQAGQPQQRGGRHVVAGDRQTILKTADAAAGGVEVGGGFGLPGGPPGDRQRPHHEDEEHGDGVQVDGLLLRHERGGQNPKRGQGQPGGAESAQAHHFSSASRSAPRASKRVLARYTYQPVQSQERTMTAAATGMPTVS